LTVDNDIQSNQKHLTTVMPNNGSWLPSNHAKHWTKERGGKINCLAFIILLNQEISTGSQAHSKHL